MFNNSDRVLLLLLLLQGVPKQGATKLIVVTLSNINGFANFFHHWKEEEILQ